MTELESDFAEAVEEALTAEPGGSADVDDGRSGPSDDPGEGNHSPGRPFYADPFFLAGAMITVGLVIWLASRGRKHGEGMRRPCPCCGRALVFHDGHWGPADDWAEYGDAGDELARQDDVHVVGPAVDPEHVVVAQATNDLVDGLQVQVSGELSEPFAHVDVTVTPEQAVGGLI